ncbi:alpha-tocopherol transfer protein-like [Phlebotomus papatasi]|uniref:alpha-tocopherol transfer protein-like n=1 Tax=Phlebotomus papatasi TaxID=29031 RepID=UPI0024839360|nr:alpha-tocopherol transfer protein-like [Phlebotomus papatasi]
MYKVNQKPLDEIYKQYSELKRSDVENILQWTRNQPHLPKITEFEAALFLHSKYYNLEETKNLLEAYHTYQKNCPKLFKNRDAESKAVQEVVDGQLHIPFSQSTSDGFKVLLIKLVDLDAKKFNFVESLRTCSMMIDLCIMTEGISNGHVIIVDMLGFSFGHIIRINIFVMRSFVIFAQNLLPIRLKQIHFINANKFTKTFISLMKPVLRKDIYDMIHIHTTMDSVYEFVPQDSFPVELGGSWKTLAELQEDMRNILLSNKNFFLEDDYEKK